MQQPKLVGPINSFLLVHKKRVMLKAENKASMLFPYESDGFGKTGLRNLPDVLNSKGPLKNATKEQQKAISYYQKCKTSFELSCLKAVIKAVEKGKLDLQLSQFADASINLGNAVPTYYSSNLQALKAAHNEVSVELSMAFLLGVGAAECYYASYTSMAQSQPPHIAEAGVYIMGMGLLVASLVFAKKAISNIPETCYLYAEAKQKYRSVPSAIAINYLNK